MKWDALRVGGGRLMNEKVDHQEEVMAYVRQAEAMNIPVIDLLNRAILAELQVREYERRMNVSVDFVRFMRVDFSGLKPEEWKSLGALRDILANVLDAVDCWRVRYALAWLRANRVLHEAKDTPSPLRKFLRRLGDAIASPSEIEFYVRGRRTEKRRLEVLQAFAGGRRLSKRIDQDSMARKHAFSDWESLSRAARRYRKTPAEAPDTGG